MESTITQIKQNTWRSWLVCITASLSMLYCFVQMTQFNVLGHYLMLALHLNTVKFSMLPSLYFWGNTIFLLPAGILIDNFSKRRILLITLIINIISLLMLAYCHSFVLFALSALVFGACAALAFVTPLSLAANWFTQKRMALVSGIIIALGLSGTLLSHLPLVWLINLFGWRNALQVNALFGGIIFLLTILIVQNHPKGFIATCKPKLNFRKISHDLFIIIKNWQNWSFGLYASLLNISVMIFGTAFGISYLKEAHHATYAQAALANSSLFVGAIIGSPFFGWLSNRLSKRKLPMYLGNLASLIIVLILLYAPSFNLNFIYLLFLLLGVFTSAQVIAYPAVMENNSVEHKALGVSLCSTLIMLGPAIAIPLFGWLLKLHDIGNTITHSATDYKLALWIVPIFFIFGFISLFFSKETYCQQTEIISKI